ncbi:hypothetical protein [Aerosakkonema funiforme]|uniref:hypothetical protein n=1 Tax=Aerosakkonema funiforme TaxID=1246630 RepID=UPI0035B75CD5
MKGRSLVGLMVSLVVLGAGSLPVLAQSQRYPTVTQMQRLRQEFRQFIRLTQTDQVGANYILDRRTQAERQNRESFVRAWLNIEPEAAPFFGSWSGFEEIRHIYPSNVRGRVCVITTGEGYGSVSLGFVSNRQIRTNNGEVIFKEGNYLGVARLDNNKPVITLEIPLNSPRPLETTTQLREFIIEVQDKNRVVQQFNAAGCTASRPTRR